MAQHPQQRFVTVRLGSKVMPGCAVVFAVFALTFLLSLLPVTGDLIRSHLLLIPSLALGKQPWRLLTAPLVVLSPFALVFLGLLLWSIGSAVEQRIGPRRIVGWSVAVLLLTSLVVALLGRVHAQFASVAGLVPIPIEGAPIFTMLLLSFAQIYGGLQVRMWGTEQLTSGRTLAWFFIGIGLCADLLRGDWEQLGGNVVTLLLTYALLSDHGGQSIWRLLRRKRSGSSKSTGGDKSQSKKRPGHKFEVLDGGRDVTGNADPARKWLN